jgi:hypothetical protein
MTRERDYLWDGSGDDPEIAALEQQLGAFAHKAPLRAQPPQRPGRRRRSALVAGTLVVVAAAAILTIVLVRRERGGSGSGRMAQRGSDAAVTEVEPGFRYDVRGGEAALCNGKPSETGTLPVGGWLETTAGVTADVQVADIGDIQLKPGSRLRLVGTGPDQHRLELASGRLSARVVAPPRLFIIDTPVAAAVDLGCAYDMEVDADGRTHLHVTSGAVSLEGHGHVAWVPWAHEVVATPGRGPGTPFASDATPALRDALARFDAGERVWGPDDALAEVLALSTERDIVTLWNLLKRTSGDDRVSVFARLDALAIRPEWVLEEDVLSAQPQALEDWRESLEGTWNVGP